MFDFDEYDVVTEEERNEDELSLDDLLKLINKQIKNFFKDKDMHYGGPIPKKILFSSHYINLLADMDLVTAIELSYTAMGHTEASEDEEVITDEMKLILSILEDCSKKGVDKEFSGGILLMCLELCEGIKVIE